MNWNRPILHTHSTSRSARAAKERNGSLTSASVDRGWCLWRQTYKRAVHHSLPGARGGIALHWPDRWSIISRHTQQNGRALMTRLGRGIDRRCRLSWDNNSKEPKRPPRRRRRSFWSSLSWANSREPRVRDRSLFSLQSRWTEACHDSSTFSLFRLLLLLLGHKRQSSPRSCRVIPLARPLLVPSRRRADLPPRDKGRPQRSSARESKQSRPSSLLAMKTFLSSLDPWKNLSSSTRRRRHHKSESNDVGPFSSPALKKTRSLCDAPRLRRSFFLFSFSFSSIHNGRAHPCYSSGLLHFFSCGGEEEEEKDRCWYYWWYKRAGPSIVLSTLSPWLSQEDGQKTSCLIAVAARFTLHGNNERNKWWALAGKKKTSRLNRLNQQLRRICHDSSRTKEAIQWRRKGILLTGSIRRIKNGTTGPGRRRRWPWRRTGPRGEKVVNQKQLDLVSLFFSVFYFTDTTICLVNLGIVGRPPLNKSLSAQWSFWCCRAKNWSSGASQPVVLFVVFFLLKKRKKMPPNPKWMAPCRHIKFYKHTHTTRRRRRTLS